jgi:hypothetical protein
MTIFQRWLVLSWSILLSLPGPLNIAFAASPPSSSIRNGEVFQKDLGPQNAQLAKAISSFDPDETWSPVEEPTLRRELVRAGGLFLHPSMQRGRYASILEFSHCRTQQKHSSGCPATVHTSARWVEEKQLCFVGNSVASCSLWETKTEEVAKKRSPSRRSPRLT